MSGAPDLYVRARAALLDAAEALAEQLDAVVLVGAQAVYLHTGDADFVAAAPYTTDADFCIAPAHLNDTPLLDELLAAHGFSPREQPGQQPGAWLSPDGIPVDLMVPKALAGAGTRGARLGPHGKRVARQAKGLEGALVDRKRMEIASLERNDDRSVVMSVAGPAALLVAKVHKIAERRTGDRVSDKDALDVLRLLQAIDTATLAARLVDLADDMVSVEVADEAVSQLEPLFGSPNAVGISMAVRAARADAEADMISASFTTLVSDLLAAYQCRLRRNRL